MDQRFSALSTTITTLQFFESVTVLFAYLSGFNQLFATESVEPMYFIKYLDLLFSSFDEVFIVHRVFKVGYNLCKKI